LTTSGALPYPPARTGDQVDEYHGQRVADPYRWLEDVDSPETRAWIDAENLLTESYLSAVPSRESIRRRITELWDYERFGVPARAGKRYVYSKNSGLQNQNVIYVADALDGPARVLIDPNGLSADGTVALSALAFSDDGRWAAYATASSGSDWLSWHVRDVESGADLPDELRWSKFSTASWLPDGSGFYYCRYAAPPADAQFKEENYNQQVWFHRLGTAQESDLLAYERPDHKEWGFGPQVSEDGRWLVLHVSEGTDPNNRVFVRDQHAPDAPTIELLPEAIAAFDFVGNDGERFYFRTTKDAERGRVVALELHDRTPVEVVPESDDALEAVALFGDVLVLEYLHDAHALVRRAALDGRPLGEVALPGLGSASGFGGRRRERETFFSYTDYTTPSSIYRLDVASGATSLVFTPAVGFDRAGFVSEQVFYTSKDGTRIPMIVTARRGAPRDGSMPTILYGYGGFNISLTPSFSPATLVWMELGGALAVPNLRGGGEYGERWHQAGTRERKQNVFDDFIAAAEFLIERGYTSRERLAISGGSNGGLLVGACMTQRPDLFGAALPAVGVMDMLRFQRFTIGWAWTNDYGSSDDPAGFRWLYAYSPLHRIQSGTAYPATLVTTADHDDRVFPAHSFKFAAALQAAQGGPAPVLIRIETKAGHGAGKPTSKLIDEAADRYAFLVRVLNMRMDDERER
jgi:prolyl oligopeptidase